MTIELAGRYRVKFRIFGVTLGWKTWEAFSLKTKVKGEFSKGPVKLSVKPNGHYLRYEIRLADLLLKSGDIGKTLESIKYSHRGVEIDALFKVSDA